MSPTAYICTTIALRWADLRKASERDRGDSPVPTAVIILGLVVIAMAVTAFIYGRANNWLQGIPTMQQPAPPV